jgi:hypothetical protein
MEIRFFFKPENAIYYPISGAENVPTATLGARNQGHHQNCKFRTERSAQADWQISRFRNLKDSEILK